MGTELLSKEDVEAILEALIQGTENRKPTDVEAVQLVGWCHEAIVRNAIVDMILRGNLKVCWANDDWLFANR